MTHWKTLAARWGSGAGETDDVRIDGSTNSLQTVSYQHHEVHGGSDYDVTEVFDLPANDYLDIQITTPAGAKLAHFTMDFFVEVPMEWWFYETVVINAFDAAITPINHRRDAGENSTLVLGYAINTSLANAESDTDTDPTATILAHGKAGDTGGGGKKATTAAGSGNSREEWILLPNTKYSLRFFDLSTDGGYIAVHLDWYEHSDKHS
ncbi:MAG: hypothetical protein GY941_21640 [Planctomycetes bacterium]|nr:hypothetical protein [Planctomycetota bacterium]